MLEQNFITLVARLILSQTLQLLKVLLFQAFQCFHLPLVEFASASRPLTTGDQSASVNDSPFKRDSYAFSVGR